MTILPDPHPRTDTARVQTALIALSAFGPLTRKQAHVLLSIWTGRHTLTPADLAAVLAEVAR